MSKKKLGFVGLAILVMFFSICFASIEAQVPEGEKSLSQPFVQGVKTIIPEQGIYSDKVTINVKDGEIIDVLNAFSRQTGKNIVIGKDVSGRVTMRLEDVPWEEALNVILRPYGYAYQQIGTTIIINQMDKIVQVERAEPLISDVFELKYLDASDVKDIIESQLSSRGRMSILTVRGQKGWEFEGGKSGAGSGSGGDIGKRQRIKGDEELIKSKTLIVADIPSVISKIGEILGEIDKKPQQVLIEARFMEVNKDRLKDIGLDFASGPTGAESSLITSDEFDKNNKFAIGGQQLGGLITPSVFGAKSTSLSGLYSPTDEYNTGFSLKFQHLTGTEFEVLLHMLEEDVSTNTLSAPRILTLDNQEASILVGTKYPILEADVSGESGTTSTSLDYYQDIGIQLNVVPQICANNNINMILHPAVSSQNGTVDATTTNATGDKTTVLAKYPILISREAETQVLMKSGETILIGGLIKDIEKKGMFKIPLLGDIPFLGQLFRRETTDNEKIDLLIFITAQVVSSEEIAASTKPRFEGFGEKDKIIWGKEFDTIKHK